MIENLDIESWEKLSANASRQHEQNLALRNSLQRQRATTALVGMMSGELDATAAIDEQLASLEARICGHQQTMKLIRVGLDAATTVAGADYEMAQLAMTRAAAQRRAELAAAVDAGLEALAVAVTAYLDSLDGSQPHRAGGNLNRAFWHKFSKARNRPSWWRQCITGLSESPRTMATVAPLSATTDPAIQESDTLEAAAIKRRTEAVAALESLTLTKPVPSTKTRSNRHFEAHLEAA